MNIYQHFRLEERDFIDQVIEWLNSVQNTFSPKLTDFLDPREQQIVKSVIGTEPEIVIEFFGGIPESERKRAIIYPDYYHPVEKDFQIQLFEIGYPKKFITIEHPQVLGSIMSLGLKRRKFGDILISGDRIQFLAAEEIGHYIMLQLTSIGRASIKLSNLPLNEALNPSEIWQEIMTTVTSLRLDTVVSAIYNLSRQKSQDAIKQGLVRINWTAIQNTAFECGIGDIISVRGYGRAKLMTIEGKTKKDRWRIIAAKHK